MSWKRQAYKKARKKQFLARKKKLQKRKEMASKRDKDSHKKWGKKSEVKAFRARKGNTNRHHILPRSLGGTAHVSNLINLDVRRHDAFHLLFGLMTFEEAAFLLMRAHRAKMAQGGYNGQRAESEVSTLLPDMRSDSALQGVEVAQ